MESAGILSNKYYTDFAPTKSAEAIRRAGCQLYYCEDMVIMGRLGNGYFASVFLVHHRPSDQFMAMKLTNEASAHRREIELLNQLNHKNVIKLFGSCVIGARFACLTELANGGNLSGLLSAKHIDLSWPVRLGLALDIANGLQHLHSHNLIHRDLSSANILIQITFPDLCAHPDDLELSTISRSPTPSFVFSEQSIPDTDLHRPQSLTGNGFNRMGDVSTATDCLDGTHSLPMIDNAAFSPKRFFSTPVIQPLWKQPMWSSLCSQAEPSYTAVVADLGLCLDLNRPLPEALPLVGNPYYIAPECLTESAPYTFAADIFAYGLLLCELATRLLNDGTQIPRTQDFGLDHAQLPVSPSCPKWLVQLAADACKVDHTKRAKLSNLITRIAAELDDLVVTDNQQR